MSERDATLINTIENESLCASCRDIADHWYKLVESKGFEGWEPYTMGELLLNADSGCLLCRAIIDNSGWTRHGLEAIKVDFEESVSFRVYNNNLRYEIAVSTSHHKLGGEIQLFETKGTYSVPTPRLFSEPRNTDNTQTWEQARKWIETCSRPASRPRNEAQERSNHWRCQQSVIEPELPTRLIRVGQSNADLKLCLTSKMHGRGKESVRYAAVSHCWGKQKFFMTTDANVAQMQQLIPFESLTKSFQECIIATRRLGLEYVWIDSLCIIQGNKSDWEIESARMGTVYACCTVNLVAADAHDGTVGCFFDRDPTCSISVRHDKHKPERMTLMCDLEDDLPGLPRMDKCETSKRGWCFQETFLSPRSIYFAKRQIWFECRCIFANEMYPEGYMEKDVPNRLYSWRWGTSGNRDTSHAWDYVLETFTKRSLTYISDRLVAIGGVARAVEKLMIYSQPQLSGNRPRYLAGLWGADFELQLNWYIQGTVPETLPLTAPSWSWASVPHGISRRDFGKTNLKLVNWHVTLDSQDEFGAVKDGFIELVCQNLVPVAICRERKGNRNRSWHVHLKGRDGNYKKAIAWIDHPANTPDMQTDLFALPAFRYQQYYSGLILQSVQGAIDTYRRVGLFDYMINSPKLEHKAWNPLRPNLEAELEDLIIIRIV